MECQIDGELVSIQEVKIPFWILERVFSESRKAFPAECCGWLSGTSLDEVDCLRQCANKQSEGNHPTASERNSTTAYVIDGDDLLALNATFESASPALVIYHSHPNGKAYLSDTDRQVATSPWGDGPAYPVQQLVVGIDEHRVVEAALFAWSEEENGFVEIARFEGLTI